MSPPLVAFVTGASRNLGRAVALRLATDGWAVAVNARTDVAGANDVVDAIRAGNGRSTAVLGDIAEETAVGRMAAEVRRTLGPVTAFVHCAAERRPHRSVRDLPAEDWRRVLAVALDAAFLGARAFVPDMTAAGYGRIVLVGGGSAHLGLPLGSTHGATSKAGMAGFVAAIAQEFGPLGVSANVVVRGSMAPVRGPAAHARDGWNAAGSSALGRNVAPSEVATFVSVLVGEAGAVVNGQTIRLDGGLSVRRTEESRRRDLRAVFGSPR